jgi:hypothetical protein
LAVEVEAAYAQSVAGVRARDFLRELSRPLLPFPESLFSSHSLLVVSIFVRVLGVLVK